jgi:polar amino acid transport system substrate-binding protein
MKDIIAELAPTGVLRAGINLSNFLLVTGRSANAEPEGVSPDMALALATELGIPLKLVPYKSPGELGDAVDKNEWDIGNIGAEPLRAQKIAFSAAYCEIEATYLVPAGSPLKKIADVDQKGVRIVVSARSAYELWLTRNIKNATLVLAEGLGGALDKFIDEKFDALAGLRPGLITDIKKVPGGTILDGQFTAVQQAIGTQKSKIKSAAYIADFVERQKKSGAVAKLIEKHGVVGRLMVAPPA